jgi:hypothetical protein
MLRLLVYGVPGTPVFEVSERFAEFHELSFFTIEKIPTTADSYFDDKIPSGYLDTGDMSSGSEQSQLNRNPAATMQDKLLDDPVAASVDYMSLDSAEIDSINDIEQGVIATEIPDSRLVDWATHVVFFNASEKRAIDWFSKRRKCPSCGNVHHLEDKPSRVDGICDRCGTDLVRRPEDNPKAVKRQFMNWRSAFWRVKLTAEKQEKLHIYSVEKFDSLDQLIRKVNRDYRGMIGPMRNWYQEFQVDIKGEGMGPEDVSVRIQT